MKKRLQFYFGNRITLAIMAMYLAIVLLVAYIACHFSYERRRSELLSSLDLTLARVTAEYDDLLDNFWSIYMPLYEDSGSGADVLKRFYIQTDTELDPFSQHELIGYLQRMANRDNHVQWIALYSPDRKDNYIYYVSQNVLAPIPQDFPYLADFAAKQDVQEMYGMKTVSTVYGDYTGIVMAGGGPGSLNRSAIAVSYDITKLNQLCRSNHTFETLQIDIAQGTDSIYTSGQTPYLPEKDLSARNHTQCGSGAEQRFVGAEKSSARDVLVYYSVSAAELSRLANRNTPMLILIVAALVVFSFAVYGALLQMLAREVGIIRTGLEKIGANDLDYRIHADFKQSGFAEIAASINAMAQSLQENVQRAYQYELKQKEAEMQELQAKFNPHFLYNTLDMFRARCYQNGDEETAELIAQMAAIFRGLIGSRTFIPLQEELAFTRRYLALFRARYGEKVQVLYDIDTEVLEYGIIRNLFQPLIENYFVHGIDTSRDDNYIRFAGHIRDENTILITVEDNGSGMPPDKLEELNRRLDEPISTEKESYGLKNLHQRLRLFYGPPCGMTLKNRPEGGLRIELVVGRVRCNAADTK